VSCNDEIAIRSCPFLCVQRQVAADKILKQRSSILVAGYEVINSTIKEIGNDAEFGKMLQKLPLQLSHHPNKPKNSLSSRFREDVMTEHIGNRNESESLTLKISYFEIIDTIQSESSNWFSEFSVSFIKSLRDLS